MSFVSFNFVVFFAAVLAGLALMPTRQSRQAFLLVANLVFYASGTPWFVIVKNPIRSHAAPTCSTTLASLAVRSITGTLISPTWSTYLGAALLRQAEERRRVGLCHLLEFVGTRPDIQ